MTVHLAANGNLTKQTTASTAMRKSLNKFYWTMPLHAPVPASALLSLRQDTPSISVPGDFQSFFICTWNREDFTLRSFFLSRWNCCRHWMKYGICSTSNYFLETWWYGLHWAVQYQSVQIQWEKIHRLMHVCVKLFYCIDQEFFRCRTCFFMPRRGNTRYEAIRS